ncbi:conserved phage C-terminal domain-containing protein [Methanobrevibacter sp.]|uniref:conserved phage C-terminal domain-containing protein n=1 Tax=Methanobrevibacter sp. TaxID=66852 RepID=UPI00388D1DF1
MQHHFDIEVATKYGIIPAILLNHLYFWIEKNKANEKNFFEDRYWTYNSAKAFSNLFPYLSTRQINYSLQKLIDEKLIITGNYNQSKYDRTLWYAITDYGYSIIQKSEIDFTKLSNGNDTIVKPIPYINTDNKQDIKYIVEYLNSKANTNYKDTTKDTAKCINARLNEGFTVEDFKSVIDKKCSEWMGTDMEKYLRPQTLFGTKFESYLNQKAVTKEQKEKKVYDQYQYL